MTNILEDTSLWKVPLKCRPSLLCSFNEAHLGTHDMGQPAHNMIGIHRINIQDMNYSALHVLKRTIPHMVGLKNRCCTRLSADSAPVRADLQLAPGSCQGFGFFTERFNMSCYLISKNDWSTKGLFQILVLALFEYSVSLSVLGPCRWVRLPIDKANARRLIVHC